MTSFSSNGLSRRSFIKKSALSAGAVLVLSRGIALAQNAGSSSNPIYEIAVTAAIPAQVNEEYLSPFDLTADAELINALVAIYGQSFGLQISDGFRWHRQVLAWGVQVPTKAEEDDMFENPTWGPSATAKIIVHVRFSIRNNGVNLVSLGNAGLCKQAIFTVTKSINQATGAVGEVTITKEENSYCSTLTSVDLSCMLPDSEEGSIQINSDHSLGEHDIELSSGEFPLYFVFSTRIQ